MKWVIELTSLINHSVQALCLKYELNILRQAHISVHCKFFGKPSLYNQNKMKKKKKILL